MINISPKLQDEIEAMLERTVEHNDSDDIAYRIKEDVASWVSRGKCCLSISLKKIFFNSLGVFFQISIQAFDTKLMRLWGGQGLHPAAGVEPAASACVGQGRRLCFLDISKGPRECKAAPGGGVQQLAKKVKDDTFL